MSIRKYFRNALLATSVFAAGASGAAMAAEPSIPDDIMAFYNTVAPPAKDNCIFKNDAYNDTDTTNRLRALTAAASADTEMGAYLVNTAQGALHYTMCSIDDPNQIGTNRIKILTDAQGPFSVFYGTISHSDKAYPPGLSEEERFHLEAFGILEEYAHGLNAIWLIKNAQLDTNNFGALLSVKELIQKIWADEALASTAAVVAARQQFENGNDKMWNALLKFPIYSKIVAAVDEAANKDPRTLTNGMAQVDGFMAWHNTLELRGRAITKIIELYKDQLAGFKANGFPVDAVDFTPTNVLQMADATKAYEAFAANVGVVYSAMSPMMFEGLHEKVAAEITAIETDVAVHKKQQAQQPSLSQ